jgi:hypothetical protein
MMSLGSSASGNCINRVTGFTLPTRTDSNIRFDIRLLPSDKRALIAAASFASQRFVAETG